MIYLAQQYFDEKAKQNPKKIAATFNDEKISYGTLGEHSNQLAHAFKRAGVERGDRVCFCLYKSINSIKAILGILKADAVYVPLDAFSPVARLKKILQDAAPKLLVCDEKTLEIANKIATKRVKTICLSKKIIQRESAEIPEYENIDTDLAYIFYTSGSTGIPKGVMITHRNLIDAAEWAVDEFNISPRDVLSSHPPFHFDLSTFDIYACLKAGATLAVVPDKLSIFPGALLDYIEKQGITIWNSVPSLLSYVVKSGILKKNRIPKVKRVFFNGEVFPTKYLAQWMNIFPKKEFVNMYGPTEATVQCSFYRIKKVPSGAAKPVPIGQACANAEIFAVTDSNTMARVGEEGELYIRGTCVSPGYWRNKSKTSEVFVQNPRHTLYPDTVYKSGDLVYLNNNHEYEFLGRKDHQIKSMGYRVELGEIESGIYSLSYVKEAAVIAYAEEEKTRIVAFAVLSSLRDIAKIKSDLEKIVPSYMVPHQFYILNELPKTNTGKTDKVLLKKQYAKKG